MNGFCLIQRKELNTIVKKYKALMLSNNNEISYEYAKSSMLDSLAKIEKDVNEKLYHNIDMSIDNKNKLKEIKNNIQAMKVKMKVKMKVIENNTVSDIKMENENQGGQLIKNAVDI